MSPCARRFRPANTDTSVDGSTAGSGADTIVFAPTLAGGTITLASGQLAINSDLTIAGPGGGVTISGNIASRIFSVDDGNTSTLKTVSLSNLTLTAGKASGDQGGAIFNNENLNILSCTIANNTAGTYGGGIRHFDNGTLILTNSTLSNNKANAGGGGIDNGGTATLTNATVTANRADADGNGTGAGGGIGTFGGLTTSTTTLFNTIVAGHFTGTGTTTNDLGEKNVETASVNNLIGDSGSAGGLTNGNLIGGDAKLGPLADNGGPTQTHALLSGSPAINAGDNTKISGGITTDLRGLVRVAGTNVDIGAFELQLVTLAPTSLPSGTVGFAYQQSLTASFPNQPAGTTYTFTANGSLPAGLTLSPADRYSFRHAHPEWQQDLHRHSPGLHRRLLQSDHLHHRGELDPAGESG